MTPAQIALVQRTFQALRPRFAEAGTKFYERLFEADPDARHMFRGDVRDQGKALFQMLEMVVNTLSIRDRIVPTIYDLGQRHANYGVRPKDYALFGAALEWTLGEMLGPQFDEASRAAWRDAYQFISDIMKEAALRSSPAVA